MCGVTENAEASCCRAPYHSLLLNEPPSGLDKSAFINNADWWWKWLLLNVTICSHARYDA